MSSELITIISVNFNTSDFLEVQLDAFKKLTKNPFKVLIADNGSTDFHLLYLSKMLPRFNNVWVYYRKQSAPGSVGHAEALDFLISKVDTPYFLVMDADAVILKKDWDQEFIQNITSETKALGAPPVKGSPKAQDFPFSYVVFLETEAYKKLNCSFMPVPGMEAKGKDTGYLIRENFFKNQLKVLCFDDHNTRHDKNGPYRDILCAEYYWKWDQKNIVSCHFARGSSDGVAKYKYRWYFQIPFVSSVLKKYLGKRDRKKWILKTYELINS